MKAIEQFKINIQRAKELLVIHKASYPRGRPVAKGPAADLLRAVIVFSVAALDAYISKRIIEVVSQRMQKDRKISDKCVDYIIGNYKDKDANRILVSIAIQEKPYKKILNLFAIGIQRKTFQKPKELEDAFRMMDINVTEMWQKINKKIKPIKGPKRRGRRPLAEGILSNLAKRRDSIVHECDMYFGKKHNSKLKPISRATVARDVNSLDRIIIAIDLISS